MKLSRERAITLIAAMGGAAAALAACGREASEPSVGERVDQGIAQVERKSEEVQRDIVEAGKDAAESLQGAAQDAAATTRDAMITAQVNAGLLRDDQLSATKIEVDTVDGRVVLRGKAPDAASRDRATRIARGVDGVVAVDNRLIVDRTS